MSQDKPVLSREDIEAWRAKFKRTLFIRLGDHEVGIDALCDLALSALERQGSGGWAERAMCEAIVATQDGSSGRMVCDVERLLHHFNSRRPQAQDAQTGLTFAERCERQSPDSLNEPPQAGQEALARAFSGGAKFPAAPSQEGHAAGPASGSPDEGGPNPQTSLRPPVNPV